MSAEGRDRIRELMVRHNPVLPHEVREKMGGREGGDEILRRILRERSRRRRRVRTPALVAALVAVATVIVLPRVPPQTRPRPSAGNPPAVPGGWVGPRIPEDLARITHISNTESLRDLPRPMGSFPQAASELLELAALAAARPRPVAGPWSYVKTEEWLLATTVARGGTTSELVPWVVRRWTPTSGGGTYLRTKTPGRPFGNGGWAGVSAGVGHPPPAPGRDIGSAADLQPRAASLSRSAPELRGQLLDSEPQTAMTPTRRLVRAMENLYSHDVVEPALSAALWRVLASQDDLRSLGRIRDRSGRRGQAFGFEEGPLLGVFVVSPATGDLLATELIRLAGAAGGGGAHPTVEEYRTFITAGWVGGAGRTP